MSLSWSVVHQSARDRGVTCVHLLISLLCHETRDMWVACPRHEQNFDILISTEGYGYEVCTRFCIYAIHHNYICNFVLLLRVMKIIRSRSFKINLQQGQSFDYIFPSYFCSLAKTNCHLCKHHYGHLSPVRAAWPFEALLITYCC